MTNSLGVLLVLSFFSPAYSSAANPFSANDVSQSIGIEERARLRDASDPGLGSLRAGWDQGTAPIQDSERAALRSAESQSQELGEMRGGDAITILVIVLIVVLILVLI